MGRRALGLTKINLFIEPTVLDALRWLARIRGTTYSELLRYAAKEYVLREITKEKQDLITLASISNGTD